MPVSRALAMLAYSASRGTCKRPTRRSGRALVYSWSVDVGVQSHPESLTTKACKTART